MATGPKFRETLGFCPQKECSYNAHLPYSESFDEESNSFLAEVKANLGRAVQQRDIKYGTHHWVIQLERYIVVYGFKFSKTDHIHLVQLLYDLVTMPSNEFSQVEKFAMVLTVLLRKKNLLERKDICLPWKPLYKILHESSREKTKWRFYSNKFDLHIKNAVKACSHYFHEDATQEMLDEWRPLLCPFDMTLLSGLSYFDTFLPTSLPPELHHKGFKLWLDEFLQLWHSFYCSPSWEGSLVSLFSRLAHDNVGFIDWNSHVPMIFTRFLRSFCLPVGSKQMISNKHNNSYDINNMSTWIVAMMGKANAIVQEHLTKLFKALHSFYHPSNSGKWTIRLGMFLQNLPKIFVKRLRRERYKELKWLAPIPESHFLTDDQVTEFVECIKSSVFVAMFSKFGSMDASMALRSLATLRPEIMIPPLLEKMYPAMETLIEPHRLIACMMCIVSVARPMLTATERYPEGRSHVLPLLNLALPGIDPNDFKKTLVTLQMLSTFVSMIPIVDSSNAVHALPNLTETEKELCSATAQFEDFVLSLLDRTHLLIESSSHDSSITVSDRLNPEQSVIEIGLPSTIASVLQQCSLDIYMCALKKIHRFATTNIFEVKVSGKLAANLCRAAVRIHPEIGLKMFVPQICSEILSFLSEHPAAVEETHPDGSLLWHLLLLSQVTKCDGSKLLAYKKELLEVVGATLKLTCVQGYELASSLARCILQSISHTYSLEFCCVPYSLDQPLEQYLPIQDWGKAGDINQIGMKWHVTSPEELEMAREMIDSFLVPQLDIFCGLSSSNQIQKEELLRRLTIVQDMFLGASAVFPSWTGERIKIRETRVPISKISCTFGKDTEEISIKGRNAREAVHDALSHLLKYLAESQEDDTKSHFVIVKIFECLLNHYGMGKNEFDCRWKSFHGIRNYLENPLSTKKTYQRALLIDRIQLQHELRSLHHTDLFVTTRHERILKELMDLSVSRYREVRKKAQAGLVVAFRLCTFSYVLFVPKLVEYLCNKELPEHIFKGGLFILQGSGKNFFATRRCWYTLSQVWPALAQCQHSEKPSVINAIDNTMNKIFKSVETFEIFSNTSATVIESAGNLVASESLPKASSEPCTSEELVAGKEAEVAANEKAHKFYLELCEKLMDLIESGTLTWKFYQIALELLSLMIHDDITPSKRMVSIYIKNCVHDLLYVREMSFNTITEIMEKHKLVMPKVSVNLQTAAGIGPFDPSKVLPGDRPDNAWIKFDPDRLITTEEEWNNTIFVEKTHWGYYTWPKVLMTHVPFSQRPSMDRQHDMLPEVEQPIYEHFSKKEFVDNLVSLLSLERDKSVDKFHPSTHKFFKCIFRSFGDTFLELFKPHIETLIKDTSRDEQKHRQCCAMEILGGVISGSKLWSFSKLEKLWAWVIPLFEHVFSNLSVVTLTDWGAFFVEICMNRDPRKLQWLYTLLLKKPLSGEGGAFVDAGRLYVIQHAIIQQEWRIPAYLHKVMAYLRPHLSHNYKAVRDRMGVLLSAALQMDFKINSSCVTESPNIADLINTVLPDLEQFRDVIQASNSKEAVGGEEESMEVDQPSTSDEDEEKKRSIRLCKTVVQFISNIFVRCISAVPVEVFQLVPILENLQSEANDEDLRQDCRSVMSNLAQILLPPDVLPSVMKAVRDVSGLKSWHARAGIMTYMQQLVFGNFFLLQDQPHKQAVQSMLLHLLCDTQVEVREMAAITLSGMIHCGYVEMDKDMMDHFERLRSTKVKVAKGGKPQTPVSLERLIQRHAGVLGLSACVQAYPYDVPEFIPQVLVDLSLHVNDPLPIGTTVTKTISNFRRTHHDSWHDHKRMFTDDQLVTLTDLLISPNYYA